MVWEVNRTHRPAYGVRRGAHTASSARRADFRSGHASPTRTTRAGAATNVQFRPACGAPPQRASASPVRHSKRPGSSASRVPPRHSIRNSIIPAASPAPHATLPASSPFRKTASASLRHRRRVPAFPPHHRNPPACLPYPELIPAFSQFPALRGPRFPIPIFQASRASLAVPTRNPA